MICPEKQQFFADMDGQHLALTFDDVRLETRSGQGQELPADPDISSYFSQNVGLRVPLVTAAMDTVTESPMAIAAAKAGGLGVIHAAMPIQEQYEQVRAVKKAVNKLIGSPICISDDQSLESVLNMGHDFTTFPVTDSQGKFIGIVSSDSFRYTEDAGTTVAEAMKPAAEVTTAPPGTTLEEAYQIMLHNKINTLPLIGEDQDVEGMYLFSDAQRVHLDRHAYNVDDKGQLRVAAAVSAGSGDLMERVGKLSKYVDIVVLDTADGDSYYAFRSLQQIKENYPDLDVVVGNITSGQSALELAEAGADGIKVGQGGGSICVTRPETGIGTPQVSAVFDCVRALDAKFPHIPVNSDGGIKNHGDIGIALAAGAHSVMMGRMLAGTREAPGNIITRKDGSAIKEYRGMGSVDALQDNAASRQRYGVKLGGLILPEGVVSQVPFEGAVADVLGVCVLALRKTMRYVKAADLQVLREQATFVRITSNGLRESHPHDVQIV